MTFNFFVIFAKNSLYTQHLGLKCFGLCFRMNLVICKINLINQRNNFKNVGKERLNTRNTRLIA